MAIDLALPTYRWNTAVSCLACLSEALEMPRSFESVAGLSGEAFRCALLANAGPGSQWFSFAWPQAAQLWSEALGLEAEIAWHSGNADALPGWLERQRMQVTATLARGLPVMYWDSLAFGLILAEDSEGYIVSGIPSMHLAMAGNVPAALQARAFGSQARDPLAEFRQSPEALAPLFEGEMLFIHPLGRLRQDPDYVLAQALRRAADELAGAVAWPRMLDLAGHRIAPLFGTNALTRLEAELKAGEVDLSGLINALQHLFEMRRSAYAWLREQAVDAPEDLQPRLKQAAEFARRVMEALRPLAGEFTQPADPIRQMRRDRLAAAAEILYDMHRTEETQSRLLRGIAADLGVYD